MSSTTPVIYFAFASSLQKQLAIWSTMPNYLPWMVLVPSEVLAIHIVYTFISRQIASIINRQNVCLLFCTYIYVYYQNKAGRLFHFNLTLKLKWWILILNLDGKSEKLWKSLCMQFYCKHLVSIYILSLKFSFFFYFDLKLIANEDTRVYIVNMKQNFHQKKTSRFSVHSFKFFLKQ